MHSNVDISCRVSHRTFFRNRCGNSSGNSLNDKSLQGKSFYLRKTKIKMEQKLRQKVDNGRRKKCWIRIQIHTKTNQNIDPTLQKPSFLSFSFKKTEMEMKARKGIPITSCPQICVHRYSAESEHIDFEGDIKRSKLEVTSVSDLK